MSRVSFVLPLLLLAPTSEVARAGLIVQSPTSDRGASDSNADGTADALFGDDDVFFRVFGNPTYFRAALEFALPIPTGSVVSTATLFLADRGTTHPGAVIQIHGYSGNGTVSLGSDFAVNNLVASYVVPGGSANHPLNVTSFVQSLVNGGATHAGFMLRASVEGSSVFNGSDIASNEYNLDNTGARPTLSVTFEPAQVAAVPAPPGVLVLATIGAVSLVGARLRRRLPPAEHHRSRA